MKEDYDAEELKQAAADVLFQYSRFVMACIGNQTRPCDLRLHLMKEISGIPTVLKKDSALVLNPPPAAGGGGGGGGGDAMGESSSSGNSRATDTSSEGGF